MPIRPVLSRRFCTLVAALFALANPVEAAPLPSDVEAALQRAGVPREALSVVVQEVGTTTPHLSWQAQRRSTRLR